MKWANNVKLMSTTLTPNFTGYLPNKTEPEAGDACLEQKLKQKLEPKLNKWGY